jgi:hypothetical protein
MSNVTMYIFRLIYTRSYLAYRENKNELEVFTAAREVQDIEPLPICCHIKHVINMQLKE